MLSSIKGPKGPTGHSRPHLGSSSFQHRRLLSPGDPRIISRTYSSRRPFFSPYTLTTLSNSHNRDSAGRNKTAFDSLTVRRRGHACRARHARQCVD